MERKEQILTLLRSFIGQRPGFEPGNYSDWSSYRSEMRSVTQDRHHAETLLRRIEWSDSITAEALEKELTNGGRLTLTTTSGGKLGLDYCTGQYFPTEYRKAVCRALASALWSWTADNAMPTPETKQYGSADDLPMRTETLYKGMRAGDWLRKHFRREFGATIANRYFD
jgi:hypothetical protein